MASHQQEMKEEKGEAKMIVFRGPMAASETFLFLQFRWREMGDSNFAEKGLSVWALNLKGVAVNDPHGSLVRDVHQV